MITNDRYKKYEVMHPDAAGDEWMEVEATDHEDAALTYAQSYDTGGDYQLMKGNKEAIAVRLKGADDVQWYEISGEAIPHYYAYTMDPPGEGEDNEVPVV